MEGENNISMNFSIPYSQTMDGANQTLMYFSIVIHVHPSVKI